MFSTAELPISDWSVGKWGDMCLVQNRGKETCVKSRNAVNYETTTIVGEDVVKDTALAI